MTAQDSKDKIADYAPTNLSLPVARIASVKANSCAWDAGLRPGDIVVSVDGYAMRDIIDWFWIADSSVASLAISSSVDSSVGSVADSSVAGSAGSVADSAIRVVEVSREYDGSWGFEFSDNIFDGVKTCCNACTFCFMAMLPAGMRSTLYLRDDDYRLSFLQGNFVSLSNMQDEDIERVISMSLSPLHVSLHAIDPDVRRKLIGPNHARGLKVLETLLDAGIEFHAQIVLVPNVNDAKVLDETLDWVRAHKNILSVGIVPLGFTKFQNRFSRSFGERNEALAVIEQVAKHQTRWRKERGCTGIHLADEFYLAAFPNDVEDHLPPDEYYDGYPQFADGIGMLRTLIDDWASIDWEEFSADPLSDAPESSAQGSDVQILGAQGSSDQESDVQVPGAQGSSAQVAGALGSSTHEYLLVCGEALAPVLSRLIGSKAQTANRLKVLPVKNNFFGGNVDVSGLLTASDVLSALSNLNSQSAGVLPSVDSDPTPPLPTTNNNPTAALPTADNNSTVTLPTVVLPQAMFNDDGLSLDNSDAAEIGRKSGLPVRVLCYNASEIAGLLKL